MNEGTVSITLKHVDKSPDCECVLTGHSASMLVTDIQRWNSADPMNIFLPVPAGMTPLQAKEFVRNSVLPLLLDMDSVIKTVTHPIGTSIGRQGNHVLMLKSYPISSEYLVERVRKLKESQPAWVTRPG